MIKSNFATVFLCCRIYFKKICSVYSNYSEPIWEVLYWPSFSKDCKTSKPISSPKPKPATRFYLYKEFMMDISAVFKKAFRYDGKNYIYAYNTVLEYFIEVSDTLQQPTEFVFFRGLSLHDIRQRQPRVFGFKGTNTSGVRDINCTMPRAPSYRYWNPIVLIKYT